MNTTEAIEKLAAKKPSLLRKSWRALKRSKLGKSVRKAKRELDKHPLLKGLATYGLVVPPTMAAARSITEATSGAYNAALSSSRMNKMFNEFPTLKEEDPHKVRMAFNTLNRLNPDFAADPLIAGTWVKRVMDTDMGSGPMIDPSTAKGIMADTPVKSQTMSGASQTATSILKGGS